MSDPDPFTVATLTTAVDLRGGNPEIAVGVAFSQLHDKADRDASQQGFLTSRIVPFTISMSERMCVVGIHVTMTKPTP